MCDYEEVIRQDTEAVLRDNYGYGKASIEQFWALNGERIIEEAYQAIGDRVNDLEQCYRAIIGDTHL